MKKPKFISSIIVIAFLFSLLRPDLVRAQGDEPSGQPQKVFLAVLDLDLSAGIPTEVRTSLSDILREQLWKTGRFRVVDRNNMERIMKEQGFQMSDCTSKECAVKVGQLLGVQEMVTGNVTLLGKTYIISVQMTKVETGEIEKMASDRCPGCEIDQLIGSIDKVSAALAEAVGGVMAPPKAAPAKPVPAAGSLNVYSDPSEAEVYWDGARVGVSAIFLKELKPGEHRLLLKKEGYAPQEIMVSVKPGLNSVDVKLKQLATIMIQGVPDGAQILLDGKETGTAPREVQVTAGSHRVKLSLAGYKGYSQDFEVQEGESRTIGYTLQSALVKQVLGSLEVNSEPAEAEVYLDGSQAGVSPMVVKDIKPGDHRLLLKKEGYAPQEIIVSVKSGLNSVQVQLKQLAAIMIQGSPDGAQIVVDGKEMGTAPGEVQVTAGSHRVELSMPGYIADSQDIEVREGENRTIGYALETLEKPKVVKAPKPQIKSKGGVAKGFYYTGLGLGLFSLIGANGAREQAEIDNNNDFQKDGKTFHRVSIALYSLGGLGAGTAILSYILMPPLSGRERAKLIGFSGVEIAIEGIAFTVLSGVMAHNERDWYESLGTTTKPADFVRARKNVEMQNKYMYIGSGIAGAGALMAIISFSVMPKEKKLGDDISRHPAFSLLPEITPLPEGGAYVGARASF